MNRRRPTEPALPSDAEGVIQDAACDEICRVLYSTAPADFSVAEAAICELYGLYGFKPPHFIRAPSPYAALLEICGPGGRSPGGRRRASLRQELAEQPRKTLADFYDSAFVGARSKASHALNFVWGLIHQPYLWGFPESLRGQLAHDLSRLGDDPSRSVPGLFPDQIGLCGSWDTEWIEFDWGHRLGVRMRGLPHYGRECDILSAHVAICRSIGWWYPFEGLCILSDRPELMCSQEPFLADCEDGPAIRYRDGYTMWALGGQSVPRQVVEAPETLTFEQVRDHSNVEVRRHMLGRFGGKRGSEAVAAWVEAGGLKPISREDITHKMQPAGLAAWRETRGEAPVTCDLYRAEMSQDEPVSILTVVCTSTAKIVPLRVPPDITDAAEARAWTFGRNLAEAVET